MPSLTIAPHDGGRSEAAHGNHHARPAAACRRDAPKPCGNGRRCRRGAARPLLSESPLMSIQVHLVVLAGFLGLMLAAAVEDLRRLTISNRLTASLCALWPVHVATMPLAVAPGAALLCALPTFLCGAVLFARGVIGGGDVKLLAAAVLWAGPGGFVALLVTSGVFGGVLAMLLLMPATAPLMTALRTAGATPEAGAATGLRAPVPYGVAIAAAALLVTLPPYLG
jgi:prepilin peptidase CpaA